MANPGDDAVIKQFRDQISDNDLKIIDAINKRLKLVDAALAVQAGARHRGLQTRPARTGCSPT